MKKHVSLAVIGVLPLLGCFSSKTTGATMYASSPDLIDVTITNASGEQACYLWMTPIDADHWGLSWLGGGFDSLVDGDVRVVRMPPGYWDIKAKECVGPEFSFQNGVLIDKDHRRITLNGNRTPPAAAEGPAPAPSPAAAASASTD